MPRQLSSTITCFTIARWCACCPGCTRKRDASRAVSFGGPMPATPHIETHFTASESVRDVVIGMADGLTVPFALAAGLSAAVVSTDVIVTAGLAEVVAGAIAMGLGGFLAARTDAQHYAAEESRESYEIE